MHSIRCIALVHLCLVACLAAPAATPAAAIRTRLDVQYGVAGGQKLLLDVYVPDGPARPRPAVVCLHGGGWAGGTRRDFAEVARGLAAQGYVAFSVGYRLVTLQGNKWPAQLDDVQRAVRWIRHNARTHGVDPARIGAIGGSAGGHLAAFLGTRDTRSNTDRTLARYSSRVQCVVDIFGPTDLTVPVNRALSNEAVFIVTNLIGKSQAQAPGAFRDASPIAFIDRKTAPFLIVHGSADPLVPIDQSRRMHAALRKAGIESKLVVLNGEGHGFARPGSAETALREASAFLARHLKPAR